MAAEAEVLKSWYQGIQSQHKAVFPYCGGNQTYRTAVYPRFRCSPCGNRAFDLLAGLPVARLGYFELWGESVDAFVAGNSIADIKRRLKISLSAVWRWELCFMRLPDVMSLHALKTWVMWQRSRWCAGGDGAEPQ